MSVSSVLYRFMFSSDSTQSLYSGLFLISQSIASLTRLPRTCESASWFSAAA